MKPGGQADRVLRYIRANPNCSTMEIQLALQPFISNPRARISDLRAEGYEIVCNRRPDGRDGYRVRQPGPLQLWDVAS